MRLASLATVLAGSALLIGLGAPVAQAASSDIVVAVEAPLTGSQADNGQDMLRGVKCA